MAKKDWVKFLRKFKAPNFILKPKFKFKLGFFCFKYVLFLFTIKRFVFLFYKTSHDRKEKHL